MAKGDRVACKWCGKFFTQNRAGHIYHDNNCKQAAWYSRHNVSHKRKDYVLGADHMKDVRTLRKTSEQAADFIMRLAAACGREIAEDALDAFWDALARGGVDLSPRE